jgi:hypothetical protein
MASYRVHVQVGALFRMGQGVHLDINDETFFLGVSHVSANKPTASNVWGRTLKLRDARVAPENREADDPDFASALAFMDHWMNPEYCQASEYTTVGSAAGC